MIPIATTACGKGRPVELTWLYTVVVGLIDSGEYGVGVGEDILAKSDWE
jgi:hypothetical protein